MQYGDNMKLYIYDTNNLTDNEYQKYYNLMSPEKKQRVDRMKLEKSRKSTVVGEMLARQGICEALGISPDEINFTKNSHGKPIADNLDIYFNISHCENLVACAVNNKEIGVDVEKIRPINLKIAKKICLSNEWDYIFGGDEENLFTRFFEIWTGKEAVFKYLGTGLTDFSTVDVLNDKRLQAPVFQDGYIIRIATDE